MRSPDREVVPTLLNPGDPCAQDEALYTPGNVENWRRYGASAADGGLDERSATAVWADAEQRFHRAYVDILGGARPWDDADLRTAAERLGVDGPRHHDARPGRVAEVEVGDDVLCDIVEDAVPEVLMLLERVTGRPEMPARPPLGAVAVLGFLYCGVEGTRPVQGWMDEEYDRALVQSVRVIDDAPMSVYTRHPQRLDLPAEMGQAGVPVVSALRPGPADPVWAGVPDTFLGRAYRVADGGGARWAFACVIPVDWRRLVGAAPALTRRLTLELWDLRRTERRATFEDVLRHRPEVVCRAALER